MVPDPLDSEATRQKPYRFACKHCGQTTHLSAFEPAKCRQCGSLSGAHMPEMNYYLRSKKK